MVEYLRREVSKLSYITEKYHEYKEEKEDFIKYLQEQAPGDDKDGDSNGVLDVKSEEISKPKWCAWMWIWWRSKKRDN